MTFEQICEENYSRIFKYIYAITCDRECAENLTQEVFYIALKKGEALLSRDTPEAFLYKTAKNLTLEHFRKSKKYRTEELDDNLVLWQDDIFDILCQKHDDTIDLELYRKKNTGYVVRGGAAAISCLLYKRSFHAADCKAAKA